MEKRLRFVFGCGIVKMSGVVCPGCGMYMYQVKDDKREIFLCHKCRCYGYYYDVDAEKNKADDLKYYGI